MIQVKTPLLTEVLCRAFNHERKLLNFFSKERAIPVSELAITILFLEMSLSDFPRS